MTQVLTIGRAVPRSEDRYLLRGRGRYTDDIPLPGEARAFILRSPHASALIRSIETAAARQMPGVLAVLTGEDAARDGLGTLPSRYQRQRPGGQPQLSTPYPVLAKDRVRFVGDAVVAIVAETLAQAKDAAEQITIDYEVLPSAVTIESALARDAPVVWEHHPDNLCFRWEIGRQSAIEDAFSKAAHVSRGRFCVSRVVIHPMEPRGAIGVWNEREDRYTLYAGVQMPHLSQLEMARDIFHVPVSQIRLVSPDIGGAFGLKGNSFPEMPLVLWAARKVGRPVRWIADRSESFLADYHGRDNRLEVALALDKAGKFLALDARFVTNLGAYVASSGIVSAAGSIQGLAGPYLLPVIHLVTEGVLSNTSPTCPYRGSSRPMSSYAIERIIDMAARETNRDPIELRRLNLIPPEAMPYRTQLGVEYDCGEFSVVLDKTLTLADWANVAKRRKAAKERGVLYGVGIASVIEPSATPPEAHVEEAIEIRFDPSGIATVFAGTHSDGQGHETMYRQLAGYALGLPDANIRVVYDDTDRVFQGHGTFGSRSAMAGSVSFLKAAERIIEKARKLAAHLLEASEEDLEFRDGHFVVVGTDRAVQLDDIARMSFIGAKLPKGMDTGLSATATEVVAAQTFPNGVHIAEVEVDPETGVLHIVRYTAIDDVGRVINPLIVEGQVQGGIVQGLGQALCEQMIYDEHSGQMLSGSLMDYALPRADDVPGFRVALHEVPTKTNPLGVKGVGEAGTVGALPAMMNAIVDALAPFGVTHFDMPATPERMWRAIHQARS